MRTTHLAAAAVTAAMFATAACAPAVHVRTAANPQASLASLRTFRILPTPVRRGEPASMSDIDPMRENSPMNRALRDDLARAFERRDYGADTANPTFAVAYYASAWDRLNVTVWDYGYAYSGGWTFVHDEPENRVTEYTQGTVIVDVIDPKSGQVLWRARGVSKVSEDPKAYARELEKTVTAIVDKFPRAHAQMAQRS
jgi:hypothetical protein